MKALISVLAVAGIAVGIWAKPDGNPTLIVVYTALLSLYLFLSLSWVSPRAHVLGLERQKAYAIFASLSGFFFVFSMINSFGFTTMRLAEGAGILSYLASLLLAASILGRSWKGGPLKYFGALAVLVYAPITVWWMKLDGS